MAAFLTGFCFVEAQASTDSYRARKLSARVFSFFVFPNCSIFDGLKNEILSRRMQEAVPEGYTVKNTNRKSKLEGFPDKSVKHWDIYFLEIAIPLAHSMYTNELTKELVLSGTQ